MSNKQILYKLQIVLRSYAQAQEKEKMYSPLDKNITACWYQMGKMGNRYQIICEQYNLYDRFGMPFHIEDVFCHILLLDEILNGTLFDQ